MSRPHPTPETPSSIELPPGLDEVVDERLWPAAETTDIADELPAGHFRALADLGLYGMVVPVAEGGLGFRAPQVRAALRRVGSGCGATAFAFAQHHGTLGVVAGSSNRHLRDRWLGPLADDVLAGIAYAHVRRPGRPVLRAERSGDGWVLDGRAPWVTSWGLAEVFGVAAVSDDGRLVWALVPGREGPGLRMSKLFDLAVFGSTATVALDFDRYEVDADHLIDDVDFARWSARDRFLAARPNPLCLGVGDRALTLLAEADPGRADELADPWADVGRRAEAMAAAVDAATVDDATGELVAEVALDDVARARAETVLATQHLTSAVLAAVGGKAMERSHPAQRLAREAGFYIVQAQNDAGRRAMLDAVAVLAAGAD